MDALSDYSLLNNAPKTHLYEPRPGAWNSQILQSFPLSHSKGYLKPQNHAQPIEFPKHPSPA